PASIIRDRGRGVRFFLFNRRRSGDQLENRGGRISGAQGQPLHLRILGGIFDQGENLSAIRVHRDKNTVGNAILLEEFFHGGLEGGIDRVDGGHAVLKAIDI